MLLARAVGARTVPVIINPSAGWLHGASLAARRDQLARAFRRGGLRPDLQLLGAEHVGRAVWEARVRGAPVVFVGGGDGTLSSAAQVLAGTPTALGVLPLGTRNHFAADLGVPRGVEEAVLAHAAGQLAAVDVGEVNGRVFLNNLSLGLYPSVVSDGARHHRHLGVPKGAALAFATLGALWRLPRVRVRVHAPGHLEDHAGCEAPFVFVANNEYAFEAGRFGTRGALDRGELAVYWAPGLGRFGMTLASVRALLSRRVGHHPALRRLLVPAVTLTCPRRHVEAALDGEVRRLRSPLRVRSRPGALRVVVPAEVPP
ncbi:MAG: sphingosine kinase [Planctomycetes bacterium]|nr:sphingosine kinase [Planctomycetota bacterium]